MTDCIEGADGRVVLASQLTGAEREVTVRRKVVDARYLESSIPATHTPSYEVDDGVRGIPVNGLVGAGSPAGGYAVIGAGKTGMDACGWLLEHGVASDQITWVKPREPWVLERGSLQAREKVADFFIPYAYSVEASALATSIPDLLARLEACGEITRLDRSIEPTMFRAAILSELERERLRTVEHVVRAGHVRRLQSDRMVLDEAEVPMPAGTLYVDCTAEGLTLAPSKPIFEPRRVTIQPIREGSPSLNAAVIGYLEATRDDVAEQNALAPHHPVHHQADRLGPGAPHHDARHRRMGPGARRGRVGGSVSPQPGVRRAGPRRRAGGGRRLHRLPHPRRRRDREPRPPPGRAGRDAAHACVTQPTRGGAQRPALMRAIASSGKSALG